MPNLYISCAGAADISTCDNTLPIPYVQQAQTARGVSSCSLLVSAPASMNRKGWASLPLLMPSTTGSCQTIQNLGSFVHSVVSQMRTQAAVSTSTGSSTGTYYGFIDRGSRFGTALGFSSSGTSSGTDSGSTDSGSSSSGTSSGIDFGSTGTRERPELTAGGGGP